MTDDRWTSIGEPAALTDALVQFRWAARFAVSAGQTFAEPRPDGGHRTLVWDDRRRALLSAPFAGAYPFRVGVRPEDLTLLFLDRTEHPLAALPLEGHTTAEGFDWLGVGVATYLGGAPPLFERPEDPMPAHPVQDGMPFRLDVDAGRAVAALYGAAAALLGEVAGARGPAEVVCRPGLLSL